MSIKKFSLLWAYGSLCSVLGILAFEGIRAWQSPSYPFCVESNGQVFQVDKVTLTNVSELSTGQSGFLPIDPEIIRQREKSVSCPKH